MVVKMEMRHLSTSTDFFVIQPTNALGVIGDWPPPTVVPLIVGRESSAEGEQGTAKTGDKFRDYKELLVPGRVTASTVIPQGAMTVQIEPWALLGEADIQQVSVGVTSFGTIELDQKSRAVWSQNYHWVRAIRLSNDCHTYNVQLKFQPSYRINTNTNIRGGPQPKLVLQAVRAIEPGQELQLWFSQDILSLLQVVFLNPSNIQGDNRYTCLRCSALYESPNPLKLHITLSCGKLPISSLWKRLANLTGDTQIARNIPPKVNDFEFKLTPDPQTCKQRNALDLTISGQHVQVWNNTPAHNGVYGHSSAFKPFKKQNHEINGTNGVVNLRPHGLTNNDLPTIWPISFETDVVQLHRNLMQTQALNDAQNIYGDDAQIESLVSSLGKAKQGHICLYCGKCYSRKYGLKIHIRTHTGYKPLRCKFCERPFGDPSNLNKHVRLHAEGNTPYKCDLCGKILVRRRDLERHLKSRHMIEMHAAESILPKSPPGENSSAASEGVENSTVDSTKSSSIFIEDFDSSSACPDKIKTDEDNPDVTVVEEKCLDVKVIGDVEVIR